jgi:ligand-binding sensor domain-containing protein
LSSTSYFVLRIFRINKKRFRYFFCLSKKLIVEIDGLYHSLPETKETDKFRTERLNSLGYEVIRFTNDEVVSNPDKVVKEIQNNNEYFQYFDCDKYGHVWAITNKFRLIEFDPDTWKYKTYYPKNFDLAGNKDFFSWMFVFDKDDNIWIGSSSGIVFFDKAGKKFEIPRSLSVPNAPNS